MRSFLILHGLQGSGAAHWQTWLAERLEDAGERVSYPTLPDPDRPRAESWAQCLHAELEALDGERTVVCHSMACMLWAREAAEVARRGPVDRVLLVAPTCPVTPIPDVDGFFPIVLDADAVAASSDEAQVVAGDADPYCPAGAQRSFAGPLGLPLVVLEGGGHVNVDAGFGPWPAAEAWCLEGTPIAAG